MAALQKRHSCEWDPCGQAFESAKLLKEHREHAHGGKFQCGPCGKEYTANGKLLDHKRKTNHYTSRDPFYTCPTDQCTVAPFRSTKELHHHQTASHPKEMYNCRFFRCGVQFVKLTNRDKHESGSHRQKLECPFPPCHVVFDTETARSDHIRDHESQLPHHICSDNACDERFGSPEDQLGHEEISHQYSVCKICCLSFPICPDLFAHVLKTHMEGTTICCAQCHVSFRDSTKIAAAISNHNKVHIQDHGSHGSQYRVSQMVEGDTTLILVDLVGVQTAAAQKAAAQKAAAQNAAAQKPAAQKPAAQKPAAKKPATQKPAPSELAVTKTRNMVREMEAAISSHGTSDTLRGSDIPIVEQFTTMRYFQHFQDILLAIPNHVEGLGKDAVHLTELLDRPSLRDVNYTITHEGLWIEFTGATEANFFVSGLNIDDETAVKVFAGRLRELFSRALAGLLNLGNRNRLWLLKAAYVLAAREYTGSSSSPFILQEPWLHQDESGQFYYPVKIAGFEPAARSKWDFEYRVYVLGEPQGHDLSFNELNDYQWQQNTGDVGLDISQLPEAHFALNLAKLIQVKFNSWLGNIYACEAAINSWRSYPGRSRLPFYELRAGSRPLYVTYSKAGHQICLIATSTFRALLSFQNTRATSLALPLMGPERLHGIVSILVNAVANGHRPEVAWGLLCATVDKVKEEIAFDDYQDHILSCPGCDGGVHLCPTCLFLRHCSSFAEAPDYDYKICGICQSEDSKSNFFKQLPSMGALRPVQTLKWRLRTEMQRDFVAMKERHVIELEDFRRIYESAGSDLAVFTIDEFTARDSLVSQELSFPQDIKAAWTGQRHHPLTPSVDGFLPVVQGLDDKTMYHFPGNVSVTSDSINRLFRHYPKYLAWGFRQLVQAKTYEEHLTGVRLFQSSLINHYELGVLSHPQRSRRLGLPCDEREHSFDQITEALTSCQPLPRTIRKSKVWRTTGSRPKQPQNDDGSQWTFPDYEYCMRQIHLAAHRYGLDSSERKRSWLRSGVFFPFSEDSIVPRWSNYDCFHYFSEKLVRMRNQCDRLFKNQANRPTCSVQELMVAVAHLHMAKIAKDLEEGRDLRICGRDEAGLLLHPTMNNLLSASIGHLIHGAQMLVGITAYNPETGTACSFDPSVCNLAWETWACNCMKFLYHSDYYSDVFAQLKNFREIPIPNAPVSLPPPEEVFRNLRDLTNEPALEIDGTPIDADAVGDIEDAVEDNDDETLFVPQDDESDEDTGSEPPDFIFRCPCGVVESQEGSSGIRISCEGCSEFQHKKCMGIDLGDTPRKYLCELCDEESYIGVDWSTTRHLDFTFRCFCGGFELYDFPSQSIIQCPVCNQWQHAACMNTTDETQMEYVCEKCDPERYEELEALSLAAAKEKSGSSGSKPAKRNMGRLQQTCFISAAVQLLLALPEASLILAGDNNCLPITGRDPATMPVMSEEFGKVSSLFRSLKSVSIELSKAGKQLGKSFTHNLLQHSTTRQDTSRNTRRWQDIPDDASEYFMYLLERLVWVSDTSDADTIKNNRTAQFNFEKELESRTKRQVLLDLETDVTNAVAAYEASGNQSSLANAITIHMVRETECADCNAVTRKFQHDTRLALRLPEDASEGTPLTLSSLIPPFFERCIGYQGPCHSCDVTMADLDTENPLTKYRQKTVRFLNAPELLIFEIDRLRQGSGHAGSELGKNRIITDTELDLKDLQTQPEGSEKSSHKIEGSTRYRRVGVLAYLGSFSHWVACVEEEVGESRRMIYYDDLKPSPEYVSPKILDQPGFCECLIVYRKIKEAGKAEPPSTEALTQSSTSQAQPKPHKTHTSDDDTLIHVDSGMGWDFSVDLDPQVPTTSVTGTVQPTGPLHGTHGATTQDGDETRSLTQLSTEQKLEQALKALAQKDQDLESERGARSKAEADLEAMKTRRKEMKKNEEYLRKWEERNAELTKEICVSVGLRKDAWSEEPSKAWDAITAAVDNVDHVRDLFRQAGVSNPDLLDTDFVVAALRKGRFGDSPREPVQQVENLLPRLNDQDKGTILRGAFREMSSVRSPTDAFDLIYTDLVAPMITTSTNPLEAWDNANESLIRPMLRALGEMQLNKSNVTTSVGVSPHGVGRTTAETGLSSRIPVRQGSIRTPQRPDVASAGAAAVHTGEQHPIQGQSNVPHTPKTAIRKERSPRDPPELPSSPPFGSEDSPLTSRERVGGESKKRLGAKKKFAGIDLAQERKRSRDDNRPFSGVDDPAQQSPLLERASRDARAREQQQSPVQQQISRTAHLSDIEQWSSDRTARRRASGASFLQPTQSSINRSALTSPSTHSLLEGRFRRKGTGEKSTETVMEGAKPKKTGLRQHIKHMRWSPIKGQNKGSEGSQGSRGSYGDDDHGGDDDGS